MKKLFLRLFELLVFCGRVAGLAFFSAGPVFTEADWREGIAVRRAGDVRIRGALPDIIMDVDMDFVTNLRTYVVSMIGRWFRRGWQEGWIRFGEPQYRGWPEELAQLFRRTSVSMLPYSASAEAVLDKWEGMDFTRFWGNIVELDLAHDIVAGRWVALDGRLILSPYEISLLALLSTISLDWPIFRALRHAMSEQTPGMPRWGYVTQFLASAPGDVPEVEKVLMPSNSILFQSGIVSFVHDHDPVLSAAELCMPASVSAYLTNPEDCVASHLSAVPLREVEADVRGRLRRIGGGAHPHVVVSGTVGSGKSRIARNVASHLKCSGIYVLDLTPLGMLEAALESVREAISQSVLRNDALYMRNTDRWSERWGDSLGVIVDCLERAPVPVIWSVTGDVPSFVHVAAQNQIRIPQPDRRQREAIWSTCVGDSLEGRWVSQLAGQFLLTRGQIESAVAAAKGGGAGPVSGEPYYNMLALEARKLSRDGLGRLATPEPSRVSMDQLIVSRECSTALQDLLMYAKHRRELAKEWGFERSMPYGLGLAALFCGPPGTGKTYGAQVIATELSLELYRVDLSQLVSKYIGETEKHLAELFNAAEQGEVLLLFDEADSVFGKRTEVKTSVDRYANLEVNFLLQRLERFSGVSILTSNFESGIDEAFMRRIRFKVPFELPEEKSRVMLWNKFLAPAIPRAADVDVSQLAELFELSGGHIKEAVLRAASIAYGSEQKCVTQQLLMDSAELEYKKLGKLLPYRSDGEEEEASHWN